MAVLREIQTMNRVLALHYYPSATIVEACIKQQTVATGKVPERQDFLVVLSKQELRAYDPSAVPITMEEQLAVMTEVKRDGAISTVPKILTDGKYAELEQAESSRALEDAMTFVAESMEPPKLTKSTLVQDIIVSSEFFRNVKDADARYCEWATNTLQIPRIVGTIGIPLNDDWWPSKYGPNAKVPIRKPPSIALPAGGRIR